MEFILDGTQTTSLSSFYHTFTKELLVDEEAVLNWSLDVLDDVLCGGYGLYDLSQPFTLRWQNFRRVRKKMPTADLVRLLDILRSHQHITLILEP